MENSININQQDGSTLITLKGVIDNELASNLISTIEKTTPPAILDLEQVPFISTLGSLAIFNFYTTHKQKLKIQGANPQVLSMLQLSGTARYVDISEHPDNPTQSAQE
ncbi:MAG: Unknown protein [uncultured Thiotrichaceae bacterium]|uniref:STAS domain-containing protein n=1 Tax=uncultured Thiotrichaceae bacterium TaxID=298394 RepID=A0A6S6S5V4_9GAMM|nr:MAG: Unknown protein [uncultured Thiotrichaceae bacterium]